MIRPPHLFLGAAAGALFVRERRARRSAERFAASLLETLLRAIDANDADTGAHVRRVARYALILGDAADLDERECHSVERVALFHDIGKIHEALFDLIHEESKLTPEERQAIRTHPQRGAEVLAPLAAFHPELPSGVLAHHERWDGAGYPNGTAGTDIPIEARIVALADTFDAITFRRRYHAAQSVREAAEKIQRGRGTQFDPELVDLFLSPPVFDAIIEAMRYEFPKPRSRKRVSSARERNAPDVTFRWRTTTSAPRLPDPAPRESL